MFKIIPQNDENKIKDHITACKATRQDGAFVYAMFDCETDMLMGISQFEIGNKEAYIYDIKEAFDCNDYEAMFILTRQTMNFIEKCGIELCYAKKDAGSEKLLLHAGFKPCSEGGYSVILTGMFDGNCKGHKND